MTKTQMYLMLGKPRVAQAYKNFQEAALEKIIAGETLEVDKYVKLNLGVILEHEDLAILRRVLEEDGFGITSFLTDSSRTCPSVVRVHFPF